jgi:hypothetical protein
MGSFYLWLAHHLYSFRPRQISGDGGFLYSAMELETAVRLNVNIVHLVRIDGTYDMVGTQERLKYGRTCDVMSDATPRSAIQSVQRSGYELVKQRIRRGRTATLRRYAEIEWKPRQPDENASQQLQRARPLPDC